ncbi:hypothetical protein A0H81_10778 [Grifola frondosa]|uniref:Uncharacterized protein n=1 Tax=Grifola frondosa TaxID=5627 RepID=A0A1C7M2P4_GRIFR|nr:hypothetical protein A0H81_10778 [Grifola frondosa]
MMTTVAEANCTSACLELTFSVPSPVSSLALGSSGSLCVGSQDGTARWYNLPSPKVVHAIKSLGDEVHLGRRAFVFAASSPKMICTAEDATLVLDLGEDDEDVLNES